MMKEENEKKNLSAEEMEKVNGGGKSNILSHSKTTNKILIFFKRLFGKEDSDD